MYKIFILIIESLKNKACPRTKSSDVHKSLVYVLLGLKKLLTNGLFRFHLGVGI